MKQSVRVIQVLDLDENSVELTCNAVVGKKPRFDIGGIMGGDMSLLREELVESMPKCFKVVVDRKFYEKNNINLGSMVDIEVSV